MTNISRIWLTFTFKGFRRLQMVPSRLLQGRIGFRFSSESDSASDLDSVDVLACVQLPHKQTNTIGIQTQPGCEQVVRTRSHNPTLEYETFAWWASIDVPHEWASLTKWNVLSKNTNSLIKDLIKTSCQVSKALIISAAYSLDVPKRLWQMRYTFPDADGRGNTTFDGRWVSDAPKVC